MTDALVLIERHDAIAVVTLNRPEALNALSSALRRRLSETLAELAGDRGTEVIILTGAGRAFTVGLDLKELGGEGTLSRGARGGTPRKKEPSAGVREGKPLAMKEPSAGVREGEPLARKNWPRASAVPTSATRWRRPRSPSSPRSTATPSPAALNWR